MENGTIKLSFINYELVSFGFMIPFCNLPLSFPFVFTDISDLKLSLETLYLCFFCLFYSK